MKKKKEFMLQIVISVSSPYKRLCRDLKLRLFRMGIFLSD